MMRPSIQMEKKIAFMPPSRMRGMSTWPSGLRLPRSKFLEKKRCVVSSCVSSTIEEKCSFRARSAMSSALEGAPSCEPASKTAQRHKLVVKRRPNRFKWRSPGQRKKCTLKNVGEIVTQRDRKSTRLNSSHSQISYAVFCLKNKK